MKTPNVVTRQEWLKARRSLLDKEKEFNRQRDKLTAQRQQLPWYPVEKQYLFHSESGQQSLADLFAGRSQLVMYHFMFGPDWEEGCPSCSFWADNYNGIDIHLRHRDTEFVAVSRAPLDKLLAYRERMGWNFNWVSSLDSDFNFDFGVSFSDAELSSGEVDYNYAKTQFPGSEAPGASVFYMDEGQVFHTYSTYARGLDMMNGAYHLLDLTPKGRDEDSLDFSMAWVRRRDQYED